MARGESKHRKSPRIEGLQGPPAVEPKKLEALLAAQSRHDDPLLHGSYYGLLAVQRSDGSYGMIADSPPTNHA